MWDILKPFLAATVRHGLTAAALYFVKVGVMPTSGEDQFVASGMLIAGLGWSWWQKIGHANAAALLQKLTAKPTLAAAMQAATAAPVGAAVKALLLGILIMGLIAPTPGHAAGLVLPSDALGNLIAQITTVRNDVVAGVVGDLTAADADAAAVNPVTNQMNDQVAHTCYPAAIKFLQSLPTASQPSGKYVTIQLFQKKRDFVAQLQAGLPVYLKIGCAPLLGDELTTFVKVMALVGVKIAPAALAALFPPAAPVLLPALLATP